MSLRFCTCRNCGIPSRNIVNAAQIIGVSNEKKRRADVVQLEQWRRKADPKFLRAIFFRTPPDNSDNRKLMAGVKTAPTSAREANVSRPTTNSPQFLISWSDFAYTSFDGLAN